MHLSQPLPPNSALSTRVEYQVVLNGIVTAGELADRLPSDFQLTPGTGCTRITFIADQSGLMGVIRNLHGLGFTLLSVQRRDERQAVYPSEERCPIRR